MALAIQHGKILLPLPLDPKEEKFVLETINKYIKFFEKRKYDKALKLILGKGHKLIDIFSKLYHSYHLLQFGSAYEITADLVKSFLGKHQHANEKRIFMYLRQLYEEFKQLKRELYEIKHI